MSSLDPPEMVVRWLRTVGISDWNAILTMKVTVLVQWYIMTCDAQDQLEAKDDMIQNLRLQLKVRCGVK